jgi:CheY-like chemotaxis protein
VDDNEDALESLSLLVKLLGNEVSTARDGFEAVEVAQRHRPEIVFMDLGMPRLNGYEAARRIREQPWGLDITLIAITGWGQLEDRRRTEEAGFDRHLVKPVEVAELRTLLADVRPANRPKAYDDAQSGPSSAAPVRVANGGDGLAEVEEAEDAYRAKPLPR